MIFHSFCMSNMKTRTTENSGTKTVDKCTTTRYCWEMPTTAISMRSHPRRCVRQASPCSKIVDMKTCRTLIRLMRRAAGQVMRARGRILLCPAWTSWGLAVVTNVRLAARTKRIREQKYTSWIYLTLLSEQPGRSWCAGRKHAHERVVVDRPTQEKNWYVLLGIDVPINKVK